MSVLEVVALAVVLTILLMVKMLVVEEEVLVVMSPHLDKQLALLPSI